MRGLKSKRKLISLAKQQAMERGEKFYLSDMPCRNGHYQRYATNSCCVECARNRSRKKGCHPGHAYYMRSGYLASYDKRNPGKYLLHLAKWRAKKKNIECTITDKDIIVPEYCPVCPWIKLAEVRGGQRHDAPTLDRIDNSKGYVPGNVRVVSWFANRLKGDMTQNDIESLVLNLCSYMQKASSEWHHIASDLEPFFAVCH